MGGLIVAGADNARRNATMRVQAVPIAEIISRFRVPPAIDYLSLDLEGAEGLAMATFAFATHRIAMPPSVTRSSMRPRPPGHGSRHLHTAGYRNPHERTKNNKKRKNG